MIEGQVVAVSIAMNRHVYNSKIEVSHPLSSDFHTPTTLVLSRSNPLYLADLTQLHDHADSPAPPSPTLQISYETTHQEVRAVCGQVHRSPTRQCWLVNYTTLYSLRHFHIVRQVSPSNNAWMHGYTAYAWLLVLNRLLADILGACIDGHLRSSIGGQTAEIGPWGVAGDVDNSTSSLSGFLKSTQVCKCHEVCTM